MSDSIEAGHVDVLETVGWSCGMCGPHAGCMEVTYRGPQCRENSGGAIPIWTLDDLWDRVQFRVLHSPHDNGEHMSWVAVWRVAGDGRPVDCEACAAEG